LIRIRIDVDYPYPSRIRSFVYTAAGIRVGTDYLRNSKIIARMINESPLEVRAYWFFTPRTVPDKELLALLGSDRHEIALHIATDPWKEKGILEKTVGRKVNYYTIHGTARLLARIMWKRWKEEKPKIPEGYPLQSFYEFPTLGLDALCYTHTAEQALQTALKSIMEGLVLHIHPDWLFKRGKLNHRGPFYDVLMRILKVDEELGQLAVRKKLGVKIARDPNEYGKDILPTEESLRKLRERGMDVFTFIERRWCHTTPNPPGFWARTSDNIALLQVTSYEEWLKIIGKKTRNMIRKAERSSIRTDVAEPDGRFTEGVWRIYNEAPIRQERVFPHYGMPLEAVRNLLQSVPNCTYIGAYLQDELAGFVQLVHGDNIAIVSQILSLQKYWDRAVNNALVAKSVEVCAERHIQWVMYGRMGNHPSLDSFKLSNGFTKYQLTRFYAPLTRNGRVAVGLGLHRDLKDSLPQPVKYRLIPLYNWLSRARAGTGRPSRPK
jgi:hypothetical protein